MNESAKSLSGKCVFFSSLHILFVFLLFTEQNGVNHTPDSSAGKASRQVKGAALTLKQFHALLVKRFHHATRSQKDFLAQVPAWKSVVRDSVVLRGLYHDKGLIDLKSVIVIVKSLILIHDRPVSDRPSCLLCLHISDLHPDCSSVRRISQSDSESLDVRTAVHLLQVRLIQIL